MMSVMVIHTIPKSIVEMTTLAMKAQMNMASIQTTTAKKTYETKCYSTPRTVSMEHCEDRKEKVCEKLTERVPIPSEKQNCHDEKKRVCELEQRSQPKQVN